MSIIWKTGLGLLIVINCLLVGCLLDAPFKIKGPSTPEKLDDDWEIAVPESVSVDSGALEKIYDEFVSQDNYFNAKSLLVIKNGKLVFEVYCRSEKDRDRFGQVQSVTKSVTSLVFGIVKSEGFIDSLDQTLYSIIPEKFPSNEDKPW